MMTAYPYTTGSPAPATQCQPNKARLQTKTAFSTNLFSNQFTPLGLEGRSWEDHNFSHFGHPRLAFYPNFLPQIHMESLPDQLKSKPSFSKQNQEGDGQ